MKRFISVLLLVLVPLLAGAQSLVIPVYEETPGGTRKWVGQTQPMPVAMASGSSSVTAADAPVTAYSTTYITATETPTLIPLLAGVTEMTLVASSPFEVYLGSAAVTASSTPIYNMTLPVAPGMAVYVGQSSAVQPRITVYQVAR
jgi:hypothetical protein